MNHGLTRYLLLILLFSGLGPESLLGQTPAAPIRKPAPTHANVPYGSHQRQVFDLWLAKSDQPTPLVLFIHSGGFHGGNKNTLQATTLLQFLKSGISVAALHYRLLQTAKLPTAHEDCRDALQYLRHRASDWNLDPTRVGAFGGSAGGQICLWLAFHDDMADPTSEIPPKRQSTRLTCVAIKGTQTTMDFNWWLQWIPGYTQPHRPSEAYFGKISEDRKRRIVRDISALNLVSADDPPTFMRYSMKPDAKPPSRAFAARQWCIHHVIFGIKLQERMQKYGLTAHLKYPGQNVPYQTTTDFLIQQLQAQTKP